MSNAFFERPILNSPYEYPPRHWELDDQGQPTQQTVERRRGTKFLTPIPRPKKRKRSQPEEIVFRDDEGVSSQTQEYADIAYINELRQFVDAWRELPNPSQWQVTPETAHLPQHWRTHNYAGAFGTQLLCEQVIGRALRRQSYDLNEEGRFNVEYADIFGIPFDFTAKPVIAPPQAPRETVQVKAIRPERDHLEIRFPRVEGYRVELPEERLTAKFNEDSVLELTPDLVGPSITRNAGVIGEGVDTNLEHLEDTRPSTLISHITKRLLETKWRDPGGPPRLYLFGQLKRFVKEWLDNCLNCRGDTYPALLIYHELADMACERITAGITRKFEGERPIKALLDPYNPTGSTKHVRFNTSRSARWETRPDRCHSNWVFFDSDWEAEFCRVAESHPKVRAYVKNHNLGPEVLYRYGSETRKYLPDFIVLVDDGRGETDPLHLIVEIKGYRREDAKEKKAAIEAYWIPGVNNLKQYGRWAFAEFRDIYEIESHFKEKVESHFKEMLPKVTSA